MNDVWVGSTILMMKELGKKRPECLFFHLRLQEPAAACQKGRLSFKTWTSALQALGTKRVLVKPPRLFSPAAKTDLYSWGGFG